MNTRKIIEFGKSSYVVSIPKDWFDKHKLKKGDLLYFDDCSEELVFCPFKKDHKKRKVEIDITGKSSEFIHWQLISKYIQNYDQIMITGKGLMKKSEEIRERIHDLISLEIIEETADRIIAGNFLNMADVDITDVLKKMDKMARSMLEDSKKSFRENAYKNIALRDRDVNRMAFLIFRAVRYLQTNVAMMKSKGFRSCDLLKFWNVAKLIERIADESKRIAKRARRMKLVEEEILNFEEVYGEVINFYCDSLDLFHKNSYEECFLLGPKSKLLIKKIRDYRRGHEDEGVSAMVEKMKGVVAYSRAIIINVCDC